MNIGSFKEQKVISIGVVKELTGLSERQIRYYEDRKIIFPIRNEKGTRKYSFQDVEELVAISNRMEEGMSTYELRQEIVKQEWQQKKIMLRGQLNAHFRMTGRS